MRSGSSSTIKLHKKNSSSNRKIATIVTICTPEKIASKKC
jgi:hypothetical protein